MSHGDHYHPPDHGAPASEHDVIKGVILDLFGRHHRALAEYIAALVAELHAKIDRQFAALNEKIDRNQQENRTMSGTTNETVDAAFAEIAAKLDKLATDLAADLAGITSGSLNATQQAAADSIKAKIDAMETTVLPPAPPATP